MAGGHNPSIGAPLTLVPLPATITAGDGVFELVAGTFIQAPPELREVAELFARDVRAATGLPLPIGTGGAGSRIVLSLQPGLTPGQASSQTLGDEGYRLLVGKQQVEVQAARPAGVFYGLQTFRQLLPPAVFGRGPGVDAGQFRWQAPVVQIEDRPRFSWRGSHLDVARHFQPKEFLFKHLDLMALHKLNVFHWHLTDDQGWRLEINKYPRLTEVGAWRPDSALGPPPHLRGDQPAAWRFRGEPHGGCYSQQDAREIVRYAAQRFITVVPEIEMPGHARAALAAYPELGNTGQPVQVETTWGVFTQIFSPEDRTLTFLQDVLAEVLDIFPSRFIHIGGDEAPWDEWKHSPAAQARMTSLGLANEAQLQTWFVAQMGAWLAARGRRLVGWDEILDGGLAPGATVMAWRDVQAAVTAARQGHDAVMAPLSCTYLDHLQSHDPGEPVGIGGFNPLENVYAFDPIPDQLPPELETHILGAQAQLWTEYMPDPRHVEYMAWPRLAALAEVVWSPRPAPGGRSFGDFQRRLRQGHLARLSQLDVAFRPLGGQGQRTG